MKKNDIILYIKKLQIVLLAAAGVFFFSRCATPEAVYMDVDVADTSSFNLDPSGENVTIFTVVENDSLMLNYETISNAMASQYETDQALEEEVVDVYLIPANEFNLKDNAYLNQLGENSNSTILIFLHNFKYGKPTMLVGYEDYANLVYKHFPFKASITVFDTKKNLVIKDTTVDDHLDLAFNTYSSYSKEGSSYTVNSEKINKAIGVRLAGYLSTNWLSKEIMLVNYPSDSNWEKGVKLASEFKFDEAIKIWMPYVNKGDDAEMQAFAAYNIAVACQMLGNKDLAMEWVVYSRRKYRFPQSAELFNELKK